MDDDDESFIKKKIAELIIQNMSRRELKQHKYILMLNMPHYLIDLIILYKIDPMIKIKLLFNPLILLNNFNAKFIKFTKCITIQNVKGNNFQLICYDFPSNKTKWFMEFNNNTGICHIYYQKSSKHKKKVWIDLPNRDFSVSRNYKETVNSIKNDKWRITVELLYPTVSNLICEIAISVFNGKFQKKIHCCLQMNISSMKNIFLKYTQNQLEQEKSFFNGILLIETYENGYCEKKRHRNIKLKSSDFSNFMRDCILKHWKE